MNSTSLFRVSERWETCRTCPVIIESLLDAIHEDNADPIVTFPVYFLLVLKISASLIQSIHAPCRLKPMGCFAVGNERSIENTQLESLAYFDSMSRGMLATILAISDNEAHYLDEMKIGRVLLEMRNMTLGTRSNACFMQSHEVGFYTGQNAEMVNSNNRHESIVLQMMHRGVPMNGGLLTQFLIYGHYNCGDKLDKLLGLALVSGSTKVLESFERAGCNLKAVHNSKDENLLLISLQVVTTMNITVYVDLVSYLLANGIDPGEVTESTETSCGVVSHLFHCCGCHYFDYINGYCGNSFNLSQVNKTTDQQFTSLYKQYKADNWMREFYHRYNFYIDIFVICFIGVSIIFTFIRSYLAIKTNFNQLLPHMPLANITLIRKDKIVTHNYCLQFGITMSHVYGMRLVFSNFKPYSEYRSAIMNDVKLSRQYAHPHILKPIGYHIRNFGSIVLIYELSSPLVPLAAYFDEVNTLHIAGQLASILTHLHDCGILLNDFDHGNFAFDEDKLIVLSMQNATRGTDFDSDIAGFIRFIESIKDVNFTAIDPLLAQCKGKSGVSAHFILDQLCILFETDKTIGQKPSRGHQRTTSGNSSNESNGTELTSLSYFSDYSRSDVFYMETRHKGLNTYANI